MVCSQCNYAMGPFDVICPRCQGKGVQQPSSPPPSAGATANATVPPPLVTEWFYSHQGQRVGPVPQNQMAQLITNGVVTSQTMVWRNGMPDWAAASLTDLAALFTTHRNVPPPLLGEEVNNNIVWAIAFAPIVSSIIQLVLGAMSDSPAYNFWWVAIILNVSLCLADEGQLKKAGHDTKGMGVWAFLLVPVYLFVRAARLKQNNGYAIVWLATFFISLFIA